MSAENIMVFVEMDLKEEKSPVHHCNIHMGSSGSFCTVEKIFTYFYIYLQKVLEMMIICI
jgi:hypothetical protein